MCFDHDSEPPIPPDRRRGRRRREPRADRVRRQSVLGLLAAAQPPGGAGMIVLPDVRGLHHYYEELALRFAENGHRCDRDRLLRADGGIGPRDEAFDYQPHVSQLTWDGIRADVIAAAASCARRGRSARCSRSASASAGGMASTWRRIRGRAGRRDRLLRLSGGQRSERRTCAGGRGLADALPGAGALRRRGRRHPSGGDRRVRRGAHVRPGSSTASSRIRARRTRSSTASRPSSRTPPPPPGKRSSTSSTSTRRRGSVAGAGGRRAGDGRAGRTRPSNVDRGVSPGRTSWRDLVLVRWALQRHRSAVRGRNWFRGRRNRCQMRHRMPIWGRSDCAAPARSCQAVNRGAVVLIWWIPAPVYDQRGPAARRGLGIRHAALAAA